MQMSMCLFKSTCLMFMVFVTGYPYKLEKAERYK
jgi:hypothetical protein